MSNCEHCKDSGLMLLKDGEDRAIYGICIHCDGGNRIWNVLAAIAQRKPVALNSVDDRAFYGTTCAYLDPMVEVAKHGDAPVNDNFYGPKR